MHRSFVKDAHPPADFRVATAALRKLFLKRRKGALLRPETEVLSESGTESRPQAWNPEFRSEMPLRAGPNKLKHIVLVHDYLIQMGGAERVVATMAAAFPDAPILTSLVGGEGLFPEFQHRSIQTTWLSCLPGAACHFKKLFPLYPGAFAALRVPQAQAVWISASTFAKCLRVPPEVPTFCYCHAPTRFLWDPEYIATEVASRSLSRLARVACPYLRRIDRKAALRMDYLIANSANVQRKIRVVYGRDSTVIHPPVNVERFRVGRLHDGYYLILSRLIGYKGIDRAIQAFAGTDRELRIVGDGSARKGLESLASSNVRFLGKVSEGELERQLARCRALIVPGEEDFGIASVEAQACGKPVIAFARGGALETVADGITGVFFDEPEPPEISRAITRFERMTWNPEAIRRHAEKFSVQRFLREMTQFMEERIASPETCPSDAAGNSANKFAR